MGADPQENVYGHLKRLHWIINHLGQSEQIVEVGCGTGYMITRPLLHRGFHCHGVDLDETSVQYGQNLLRQEGLDPAALKAVDFGGLEFQPDVVIASEVLEHIPDSHLPSLLTLMRSKIHPGGKLLVTVPNGYGWFELEAFIWYKLRIGAVLEFLRVPAVIYKLKRLILRRPPEEPHPSTLASSPHVQWFTRRSIRELLEKHGFEVQEVVGSTLFAGPFSNLAFGGLMPLLRLNCILGQWLTTYAVGFYLLCRVKDNQ
jgi:SAM-dependent methyltransferase